jgi:hypothetical protein
VTARIIPFYDETADETVAAIATAGMMLHFVEVSNVDNDSYFLQLFNVAATTDVTLGTTTPTQSFLIPAGNGTLHGAMDKVFDPPIDFTLGLSYAITTTAGGNTGPTTAMALNAGYR